MSKCRYDLTEDCHNKDCLACVIDKIRTEIEKTVWEDVIVSLDGTDETRIPRLEPDDVFEIIDKYWRNTEINTERKCCDCKHFKKFKSGERGGIKGSCRIKSSSGYQDCRYGNIKACTRHYEPLKGER